MKYLLDSNVLIAALGGSRPALRARLAACDEGDLVTSSIVYAEVAHGALKGKQPAMQLLDEFLVDVPVLPFDKAAALAYGSLKFERDRYDNLIAAHAIALGVTVLTDNLKHFKSLAGVRAENWMS